MAKPDGFIPLKVLAEPLTCAKRLAEKMARVLDDEDVSDVAIAVALLTTGVVDQYADGPAKVTELVNVIRKLEDRFLLAPVRARNPRVTHPTLLS
jgi:hypothetical protein